LLWAADVGRNAIEEVNIIQKGKNHGWNIMEGNSCCKPSANCDVTGFVTPIWQYPHSPGNAIVGRFVYRGKRAPGLICAYIYGDNGSGHIWSLRYDGANPPINDELIHTALSISTFGVGQNNELYICAFDGKIYQFKTTISG
jgi:glucose/arabinose dehydrogenase